MPLPLLVLPRAVPLMSERPPQETIPPTRVERERVRAATRRYATEVELVLPLSFRELKDHAEIVMAAAAIDAKFLDYVAVVLNSEASRDALAAVPYDRRLLLLPKCLRVEDRCPAPFDEFGLLCKQCGLCTIQDLQNEAERLGYAVLVAEGSALVMAIIETGKIDAIVGVSCLSVLEKAFPFMEAAAIPGVAVPLLQDDCKDTGIDVDWVWDFLHVTSDDRSYRLDLDAVRKEVDAWFTPISLAEVFGTAETSTEQIGQTWLAKAGKRWRPFLVACVYKALQEDPHAPLPRGLQNLAVAVECFHKASLAHDDIEDADTVRYDEPTLHAEHGVPIALNVGDYLLGEGYRLIAGCDAPPQAIVQMIQIAAEGHRTLSLGQGDELAWTAAARPLSPAEVASIHRRKTAPAFEVALRLGATYGGADSALHAALTAYSEALGIAYQIRDDIEDFANGTGDDIAAGRPSFPYAVALERAKGPDHQLLEAVWRRTPGLDPSAIREVIERLGAIERSQQMLESYKEQAIRSLMQVTNPTMKGLLRRVVSRIFRVEIEGWCREFETRNAPGRAASPEVVGGIG
jgi:geranylgeranyl diphosphate synthase, type II